MESELLKKAREFHHAILLFQRRMRKVRLDYKLSLDPESALFLSMLVDKNAESFCSSHIATKLGITKTRASRFLYNLESLGFLKSMVGVTDRRMKVLKYTEKGLKELERLNKLNNEITKKGLAHIGYEERLEIGKLFESLNNCLGFQQLPSSVNESPMVREQIRLATGSGMIGINYMNTGLDIGQVQVLFELSRSESEVHFSELEKIFGFHKSKLSRILHAFEKIGYVRKVDSRSDARRIKCVLTPKGKAYFNKIDISISERITGMFSEGDSVRIEKFIRIVDQSFADVKLPIAKSNIQLRVCKSKNDFYQARRLLIELLVENSMHMNLESELLPESRLCLLCEYEGDDVGILVADNKGHKEYVLTKKSGKISGVITKQCMQLLLDAARKSAEI